MTMNSALVICISCCVAVAFGTNWGHTSPPVRCYPVELEGEMYGEVVSANQPVTAVGFMGNFSYSYLRQMEYSETVTSVGGVDYHKRSYKDWRQVSLLHFYQKIQMVNLLHAVIIRHICSHMHWRMCIGVTLRNRKLWCELYD